MEQEILKKLEKILRTSLQKALGSEKRVAMVYSGGIDSSLIAFLAHQSKIKVTSFTVGFEDSADIQFLKKVKKQLPFPLLVKVLTAKDLKRSLPMVTKILTQAKVETNLMQIVLAMGLFLTLDQIKKADFRLALSGQGADEIFAGYHKFSQIPRKQINQLCRKEVKRALRSDLVRDQAIAQFHQVKLKTPYLDPQVIKFSLKIPPQLKIKKTKQKLTNKYVLRKLGEKIGLPRAIFSREKKSFQYSTRIQRELVKLLKRKSLTLR